ncbi:MAG: TIM barrel protein [Kutzneria sp.]|nr:TIM barrel protein [Kutzneria sp.]MBV9845961.1 TIM barrel protein [Kutzneria sp.]
MTLPIRVAGAPISWGVCEVPDWGRILHPDFVLGQMARLGLRATELGPPGYLPGRPAELADVLDRKGLSLVGGFLAVVLHDTSRADETVHEVERFVDLLAAADAGTVVLAAATGLDGYDRRPDLTADQWRALVRGAAMIGDVAKDRGIRAVLHPHVGTHVERRAEIERFLAESNLPLCLDTGHLVIGGVDPAELVERHSDRIGHVHLKDVRSDLADEVRSGRIGYADAVRRGMYVPLGDGDVRIDAVLRRLCDVGYDGWYVLEQDAILGQRTTEEDDKPLRDNARSIAYLETVLGEP